MCCAVLCLVPAVLWPGQACQDVQLHFSKLKVQWRALHLGSLRGAMSEYDYSWQ